MSATFDDLRDDFTAAFLAIERNGESTRAAIEAIFEEQRKLWADNAALRDELHESVTALSNRIEGATRG